MKNVLVIGAVNIDIVARPYNEIVLYDKNPGEAKFSFGGVGRNICENLARLDINPTLLTIIGNDSFGISAVEYLEKLGAKVIYKTANKPTSTFISFLDNHSDNYLSVSSMDIVNDLDIPFIMSKHIDNYDIVVCDANSKEIIDKVSPVCKKLFVDSTSVAKVNNISAAIPNIDYLQCNQSEFKKLFDDTIENVIEKFPNLTLFITMDEKVIYNIGKEVFQKEVIKVNVVNAVGAGDSFAASIVYGLARNYSIHQCVDIALKVASHTVTRQETVSNILTTKMIGE